MKGPLYGSIVQHNAFLKFFPEPDFQILLKEIKLDCKTKATKCEKVVEAVHVGRQIDHELQSLKGDASPPKILKYKEPIHWLDGTKNYIHSLGYREKSDTGPLSYGDYGLPDPEHEYTITTEQVGSSLLSTAFPDKS